MVVIWEANRQGWLKPTFSKDGIDVGHVHDDAPNNAMCDRPVVPPQTDVNGDNAPSTPANLSRHDTFVVRGHGKECGA